MIKKIYNHFMNDSLYRNSIYLMLNTVVMAGFGFIFWMINARLFTAEEVGMGSTLISVISLIVTISLLGMNVGLVRFLPTSKRKNHKINTIFTITGLISIAVSTIFILGLSIFSPKLLFIKHNLYYSIFFILSMVGMTLSGVIDSVYNAYRKNEYTLIKNTIFSIGKIVFSFLLVSFGAMGIFGSWTISMSLGFFVVFLILIFKFGYRFELTFYDKILRKIMPYSFANYITGFVSALPLLLFPIIITNKLDPFITAYYYIAITIAGMLFSIPNAITNSLFAEGSNNSKELKRSVKKSIKLISLIMIPTILITFFFGKYLLILFGNNYSLEGFEFLQMLAISALFVSINSVYSTIFKIKKRMNEIIIINIICTTLTFIFTYALLYKGLLGIGIAWLTNNILMSVLYLVMIKKPKRN